MMLPAGKQTKTERWILVINKIKVSEVFQKRFSGNKVEKNIKTANREIQIRER